MSKKGRKLNVVPSDLVSQLHDYDIDVVNNEIYLFQDQNQIGEEYEPGVEYVMANRFIRNMQLCMKLNPGKPILIHMKTHGGDWQEGMSIYNTIKSCGVPTTILAYTLASSMSSIIFLAASKRVMMPDALFMFHDGSFSTKGTRKQARAEFELDEANDKRMMQIYSESILSNAHFSHNTTLTQIERNLRKLMDKKEDVYLSAMKAVTYGFCDEIFDGDWSKLTKYTDKQLSRNR